MRRRIAGSLPRLFNAIKCIVMNGDPAVRITPAFSRPRMKIDIGLARNPALHNLAMDALFALVQTSTLDLRLKGGGFSITHRMETIEPWWIDRRAFDVSASRRACACPHDLTSP